MTKLTISGTKGLDIKIDKVDVEAIKVVASPLKKLPNWHPGKGDKGWFFIDEVFFIEFLWQLISFAFLYHNINWRKSLKRLVYVIPNSK